MKHTHPIPDVEVELRKRVPATTGKGFTTVKVGTRSAHCTVTIDTDKLMYLARRAALSSSKKATIGFGAVVVTMNTSVTHEHDPR